MQQLLTYFRELDNEWRIFITAAGRIVFILALAWLLQRLAGRLILVFQAAMAQRASGVLDQGRVKTLARVVRYTATVIIAIIAGTLVLNELGISVAPILATAGVAGVAIGFGAQSLVKDYFTGFFLLLEDQIRQGDVVQIGDKGGVVEEITLRFVRLRDADGHVHFIPNGEIKAVTNRTRDYAYALVEVGVAYGADLDRAMQVMRDTVETLRRDEKFAFRIVGEPEVWGVERLDASSVALRLRVKTLPTEQWNVKRELLKRLKAAFDKAGVEIPFPNVTVHTPRETLPQNLPPGPQS